MTLSELEHELADLGVELHAVYLGRRWSVVLVASGKEPVQALHDDLAGAIMQAIRLARDIAQAREVVGA